MIVIMKRVILFFFLYSSLLLHQAIWRCLDGWTDDCHNEKSHPFVVFSSLLPAIWRSIDGWLSYWKESSSLLFQVSLDLHSFIIIIIFFFFFFLPCFFFFFFFFSSELWRGFLNSCKRINSLMIQVFSELLLQ